MWKQVVGYEHEYQCSDEGEIRNNFNKKILTPHKTPKGYLSVRLYRNKVGRFYFVHSVIAMTFIGQKPKGFETDHKDTNKENNNIDNLEYVTSKENSKRAWENGLHKNHICGSRSPQTFLTEEIVLKIREEVPHCNKHGDKSALAKKYNISKEHLNMIIHRKSWKHI